MNEFGLSRAEQHGQSAGLSLTGMQEMSLGLRAIGLAASDSDLLELSPEIERLQSAMELYTKALTIFGDIPVKFTYFVTNNPLLGPNSDHPARMRELVVRGLQQMYEDGTTPEPDLSVIADLLISFGKSLDG